MGVISMSEGKGQQPLTAAQTEFVKTAWGEAGLEGSALLLGPTVILGRNGPEDDDGASNILAWDGSVIKPTARLVEQCSFNGVEDDDGIAYLCDDEILAAEDVKPDEAVDQDAQELPEVEPLPEGADEEISEDAPEPVSAGIALFEAIRTDPSRLRDLLVVRSEADGDPQPIELYEKPIHIADIERVIVPAPEESEELSGSEPAVDL